MRLFIAVNFTPETKNKLLALRDELQANSSHGNFCLPENLHLTLAFLGECTTAQTEAIKSVMNTATFDPFDLTIDRIGYFKRNSRDFSNRSQPTTAGLFSGIWWAGIKECKPLLDLQQRITTGLSAAGFETEKQKYSPHITLGRQIVTSATPRKITPFGETVCTINLMKSERIAGKLSYTSIYRRGKRPKPIAHLTV